MTRADPISPELPPDWVLSAFWWSLLGLTVLVVGWAVVRLAGDRRLGKVLAVLAIGAACLAGTGSLWLANTRLGGITCDYEPVTMAFVTTADPDYQACRARSRVRVGEGVTVGLACWGLIIGPAAAPAATR